MPLPRLHLFELEDLPWFPATIRDLATDYLHIMDALLRVQKVLVPLVERLRGADGQLRIVDLCSGGGGPARVIYEALKAKGKNVHITLTDKFPNLVAFKSLAGLHPGSISFCAEPVDATAVPEELKGVRTLFNAFHHFAPKEARAVLESSVEGGQGIGIFEISERAPAMMLAVLLTPVYVALLTPFMRPFRWDRLLWTYLVPAVPFTCLFDGIVSQFRVYTVPEMTKLTEGLDGFRWEAGSVKVGRKPGRLTYLLGVPREPASTS